MSGTARTTPLISVVIPVFNWDTRQLLAHLVEETLRLPQGGIDITVMDDCSTDHALEAANRAAVKEYGGGIVRYIGLERNTGRARIRNLLAGETTGEFLLFLDADVLPDSPSFLADYHALASEGSHDAFCGGISYRTRIMAGREFDFFLYLSSRNDVKPARERNRKNWRFLHTANILIRRRAFLNTPFDERFTGHGYEDCEWGIRLCEQFRVTHIDNPVSHLGLVNKNLMFQRMRDSLGNYMMLSQLHPLEFNNTPLARLVRKLSLLPSWMLGLFDILCSALFRASGCKSVQYLLYQVDKSVLLAVKIHANRV